MVGPCNNGNKQQYTNKIMHTFTPENDWSLLKQGAEARIWKIPNFYLDSDNKSTISNTTVSIPAICKERFPKTYRHPVLDSRLTKQRCRMEARILGKCQMKGITVPIVYKVDTNYTDATSLIYLEYVDGLTVRDYLEDVLLPQLDTERNNTTITNPSTSDENGNNDIVTNCTDRLHKFAQEIGIIIARLHDSGIVHGDLTTSNMMLKDVKITDSNNNGLKQQDIVLIDFGLAKNTVSVEERAVDLYVFERALQSTHPTLPPTFVSSLLSAYAATNGTSSSTTTKQQQQEPAIALKNSNKQETLTRLEKVRQRGRKRECFG